MIFYFAYGSNMNPMRMRQRGVFIYGMRPALLHGYRLIFNKQASEKSEEGYSNIKKDNLSRVEGVLYEIDEFDLNKLDVYEGYPVHYNRIILKVSVFGGWSEDAIVYIANPNQVRIGLKPSQEYLSHLLSAKRYLSKEYYKQLLTLKK